MTRCEAHFRPRGTCCGDAATAELSRLARPSDDVAVRFRGRQSGSGEATPSATGLASGKNCAIRSNRAAAARRSARERANAVHAGGRAPARETKPRRARAERGIFREKYWRPRERGDTPAGTAVAASRRGYVPSWMLSDCRRSGPNNTCTNYGGLPRKEQAIRREPERRLLCVKGAPRCGGARSCAPGRRRASNARRVAHATTGFRIPCAVLLGERSPIDLRDDSDVKSKPVRLGRQEVATATSEILGLHTRSGSGTGNVAAAR